MNLEGIKLDETRDLELTGVRVAEGFRSAYNCETKTRGVVEERTGKYHMTLPINGWRGRDLAEMALGVRDTSEWHVGRALIIDINVLRNLPGFDGRYVDYLDEVAKINRVVTMKVAVVDPTYGVHVVIEPASEV